MKPFQSPNSGIEVIGSSVLIIVQGLINQEFALKVLAEKGLKDINPEKWYPLQSWLDAYKTISDKIGPVALFAIGKKIPELAKWPPQVNSIETALSSLDIAYHMNHRLPGNQNAMFDPKTGVMQEGIGHYKVVKTGDRAMTITCDNPYPCEFDKGVITATAKKFKPADVASIIVIEDESVKCRNNGGQACVYKVTW